MNILLTGGAGYIGSHIAVALAQSGFEVVLLDNFCNSQKNVLERLQKILGKSLPCFDGDIRDTSLLCKVLQDYKIDAVIHLAGLKAVGESVKNPIDYYANNVNGAISLLEAMQSANVKTMVFSSSATVYGDPHYLPLDEQHPTSATNAYGRTKLHIEKMLQDVANSDSDWRIVCLRYFNPVGAHESGLIGESPKGVPNNLMPYIAKVASGELAKLTIFGNNYPTPDGTGVRDYIHVEDLANGHRAAILAIKNMVGCVPINLGTGRGYSVLEIVESFEKATTKSVPFIIAGQRAGDIAACYADPSRAKQLLSWEAQYGIDRMCIDAWRWQVMSSNGLEG